VSFWKWVGGVDRQQGMPTTMNAHRGGYHAARVFHFTDSVLHAAFAAFVSDQDLLSIMLDA